MDPQALIVRVTEIHRASDKAYGSPRIRAALMSMGIDVSARKVQAAMRAAGIAGARIRKRRAAPIDYPPNLLLVPDAEHGFPRRCFQVSDPDRVWLSDI